MEISLVKKQLKSDRKVQTEVYNSCCNRVYASCLRILNDPHEAEDFMQEAFIQAFDRIDSYRGDSQLATWICRIAINKCLDHLKKRKVPLDMDADVESGGLSQVDEVGGNYDIDRIKRAMKDLPEGCRVVFSLHLFEDMDHKSISKQLGIKEASSRAQYARAKNKIIELVNETYV
ncbi:MAG: sigma-70 family RNA polymerase sigma factor [Cryomorphaceae bacterium]